MVVDSKKIEKTCCFYVSEFHLEMIIVPYINEKIEENITILTQKNLKQTVEILISRMNLNEESKQKILNLEWEGEKNIKEKSNIIIVGSKEFIRKKNQEIENKNPISVLDCYDLEEIENNINDIANQYENILNTLGNRTFENF